MAPHQTNRNVPELRRQPSLLKDQGKRPQGVKKERPQLSSRKSARLEEIKRHQKRPVSKERNTEQKLSNSAGKQFPESLPSPQQAKDRKRKRTQNPEDPAILAPAKALRKRPRTTVTSSVVVNTLGQEATCAVTDNKVNPIDCWREEGRWPKEYFKQDDQTRKDLEKDFEKDSWFEKYWVPEMSHLIAQKKSSPSLRGKQSEAGSSAPSSTTPSDQKPREEKSAPYKSPQYRILLETKDSFMRKSELGIADTSKIVCRTLLETQHTVPEDSLFQDEIFDETCEMIQDRNEAKVIQDIARLIVPSAQSLAIRGAKHLKTLIESINEGWDNSIPLTKPRPQPDYAVGFKRTAFTEDQLKNIQPFIGGFSEMSFFMGTYYLYFPFLTCEVKCGAAALDIADRQNAHSMSLAVRGVVELFRLKNREKEIHREILAFSISHDHRTVRIYGHYAVIDGKDTTFYRHPIKTFDFTSEDGKDKWTAYKFTKNVYDIWMPTHFKRICSVIDEVPPGISFEVPKQSELQFSERSGLSQALEDQNLSQQSNPDTPSLAENDDGQSRLAGSITPNTSLSHETEPGVFKKPRKRRAAG